jgi:hypothetical protein
VKHGRIQRTQPHRFVMLDQQLAAHPGLLCWAAIPFGVIFVKAPFFERGGIAKLHDLTLESKRTHVHFSQLAH